MMHVIFDSIWGWLGVTTIIVIACGVVAWFIPPLRRIALEVGGVALAVGTIYAKGNRDRAALEQKRKDEAVRKAQADYAKINERKDTPDTVAKRLRDNSF